MTLLIFAFLAGWFSAVLGFEVAPLWGNVLGLLSFLILAFLYRRRV